jgi:RNA 2',3'-cyclic 3'-phosphodiesterase
MTTDDVQRKRTKPGQRRKFTKERPPDPHGVEQLWRLFIALPVPEPVVDRLTAITDRLQSREWPVRWTGAASAHLTLHFIGEVEPSQAELLRMSLPAEIARHQPFTLQTDRLGVFPDRRKPRVLWMGLDGETDRLTALHDGIGTLLTQLEFEVEERTFSPHLTLGRLREEISRDRGMEIWTTLRGFETGAPLAFPVEEVILYRSYLTRSGAQHEPLIRCPLKG